MLLYIILCIALKSVTCAFPSYIYKCPLPNPNANDCVLNNAKIALPYILGADPTLGLPTYNPIYYNGDILILEYLENNSEIQLFGATDPHVIEVLEASYNTNWPSWRIVVGGAFMTYNFDFILKTYVGTRLIEAKGHVYATLDNWSATYTGEATIVQINNQNVMQISWGWASVTEDTYDATYTGLSTLDNQSQVLLGISTTNTEIRVSWNSKKNKSIVSFDIFSGADLIRVRKALRNFENTMNRKGTEIAETGFSLALNTILGMETAEEVFSPAPNPCTV